MKKGMKRRLFLIFLVLSAFSTISLADNCFKIAYKNSTAESIPIGFTVTTDYSFKPFSGNKRITGLSIDAHIVKSADDYLVRILLKDTRGAEYLIMESYKELYNDKSITFSDYCEETALLENVCPDSIKIIVKNASVNFIAIKCAYDNSFTKKDNSTFKSQDSIKKSQASSKAQRVDAFNKAHDKLWRAGVTSLSLKSFSEKKRILGMSDNSSTNGFEYYVEGIYEFDGDSASAANLRDTSNYIDTFDWRNRHGKNWLTSIKNQGSIGFCYFFTCIGCLEALTNLYYNQKIDFDLSEEELACCSGITNPQNGITFYQMNIPLNYLVGHGVCDEEAYPFVDDSTQVDCKSNIITPNENVKINGYTQISNANEDNIKSALIHHGPLITGIHYPGWINHAMVLVGYGILQEGDSTYHYIDNNGNPNGHYTVHEGDPRIGRTYYVYKNSCGINDLNTQEGYFYFIHNNYNSTSNPTYYCHLPITTTSYTDNDIICEDTDGDGYYFWGLGNKPANCPSWVPDEKDGDDSNINYGPIDTYGYLMSLPEGITINTPTSFSQNNTINYRIGIVKYGVLTITGTTTQSGNSKIRVCENGTLIVDGGTLQNADIEMIPGSSLIVRNGGIINMASGKDFDIPVGVQVNIENGVINTEPLSN